MNASAATHVTPTRTRGRAFGSGHAVEALFVSLAVYGLGFLLVLALSWLDLPEAYCLALAHLSGACALASFWRLGRWGRARFDSFGAALLLMGVFFRLQATLDALVYGTRIEDIHRYPNVPLPYDVMGLYYKAEFITVLGLLLVACTWRRVIGPRVEEFSFLSSHSTISMSTPRVMYAMALGVDIARRLAGIEFGPLAQFLSLLFIMGVVSIHFICSRISRPGKRLLVAALMALPMSFLALSSGMKEEIFFPLIPAVIIFWKTYKQSWARTLFIVGGTLALAMAQLYVFYVRETTWRTEGDLSVSIGELIGGFVQNIDTVPIDDAFESISSRVNLTYSHVITIALADYTGFDPQGIFGMIPISFIPRVLWADKPSLQPGLEHTARILGVEPTNEIRSASATGFAAGLYLGGGWPGVILGASLYGFLLARAQLWSLKRVSSFGHLSFCFIVMYWTLRFDEKHVVYAYTSVAFTVVFLWMMKHCSRVFASSRSRAQAKYAERSRAFAPEQVRQRQH